VLLFKKKWIGRSLETTDELNEIKKDTRAIFYTFIAQNSPNQINISSQLGLFIILSSTINNLIISSIFIIYHHLSSDHIINFYRLSSFIILSHIISYLSYHLISLSIISFHIISSHIISSHIISSHIISSHINYKIANMIEQSFLGGLINHQIFDNGYSEITRMIVRDKLR